MLLYKKIIISSCLLFLFSSSYAQSTLKIGIANTDSILVALPEYTATSKNLENYTKQWLGQVETKKKELESKNKDFVDNQRNYIPEVLEEKAREIQGLQQSIQELEQRAQASVQNKQAELLQPLIDKIREGINQVAKEKDYTFIFAHNAAANYPFLYADETEDITEEVIRRLSK